MTEFEPRVRLNLLDCAGRVERYETLGRFTIRVHGPVRAVVKVECGRSFWPVSARKVSPRRFADALGVVR